MVNVTLHPPGTAPAAAPAAPVETPSQRIVREANAIRYVTDDLGRSIGWRKLNALEDFDLTEIAGANATNSEWMLRASIAYGVREIDGDPVPRPANKQQLRALVARLEDPGMTAILSMVFEADAEAADGGDKERAQNFPGAPKSA